jgi:hypothetical protein
MEIGGYQISVIEVAGNKMQLILAYNLHSNSPSLPLKNKEILNVNYRQV